MMGEESEVWEILSREVWIIDCYQGRRTCVAEGGNTEELMYSREKGKTITSFLVLGGGRLVKGTCAQWKIDMERYKRHRKCELQ